jgi:hypothetical protein
VSWAVACIVWVVTVEQQWKTRHGPFVRFGLQLVLWMSAAFVAVWLSDHGRVW